MFTFLEADKARYKQALSALEKMEMAGKKEAGELNIQYDKLRAQTAVALKAQEAFEREKLGMHNEAGDETETVA